jgi:hypothetical protein
LYKLFIFQSITPEYSDEASVAAGSFAGKYVDRFGAAKVHFLSDEVICQIRLLTIGADSCARLVGFF